MSGEATINSCRNCGARLNGCVRCGRPVAVNDLRVGVSFSIEDVERLALGAPTQALQERLLCALGTIDRDAENRLRMDLARLDVVEVDPLSVQLAAAQSEIEELRGVICDMENTWQPRQ